MDAIQQNVDSPIGTIVASGDFVSKGNGNSYGIASQFLDDLAHRLKLTRSNCVVVPGNHDFWTIGTEHPTRTYGHETAYRQFLEAFQHEAVQDLERIARMRTPSGWDLVFISLNSARIRADNLKEYGYVSRHRYDELLKYMRQSLLHSRSKKNVLIFAVLHHHIMPAIAVDVPDVNRPVSLTLDAGEMLEEFCKAGVGYVLHGHQHMPFVGVAGKIMSADRMAAGWSPKKGNPFILGAGSAGAATGWLPQEFGKNAFAVYAPTKSALQVKVFQFLPQVRPSTYWSGSIPLQNFYDLMKEGKKKPHSRRG